MARKRYTEEQIIAVLNEAEAGAKTGELCRLSVPGQLPDGAPAGVELRQGLRLDRADGLQIWGMWDRKHS